MAWGMLSRKERWSLSLRGWIVLLTVLSCGVVLCFLGIHPFLAVTDRVSAQTLVIEGWVHQYTIKAGADIFRRGNYSCIFTTGGPVAGNGTYSGDADTTASVGASRLKREGIPKELIQIVPAHFVGRDRTYISAVALRDWFQEHNMRVHAISVVTEAPHARRTRLLFQKAFGRDVQIGIIAVQDPDYDPKHWWRTSEGVRDVVGEAVAYLYARIFFHPGSEKPMQKGNS